MKPVFFTATGRQNSKRRKNFQIIVELFWVLFKFDLCKSDLYAMLIKVTFLRLVVLRELKWILD